ncbi:MAG: hypothetical protein EA377_09625 [Phycisphaerales bacterium]|nr:MAG: hypothetical protein EA377_09625 [Phycisphaerales bacterium]
MASLVSAAVMGQSITPEFAESYTVVDLGSIPGVPTPYGGVTFKWDEPDVLLIGGAANSLNGAIYAIQVERGCDNFITGFIGTAELFATAPRIDGGLTYGPDNILFYTTYSNNTIGQIKPGSTEADRVVELGPLGVTGSTGSLMFVPEGMPGAGRLKIVTYSGSNWWDATIAPDRNGTFDIIDPTLVVNVGGGPEGVVYIAAGNPNFLADSVLITKYGQNRVDAYEVDANGDPILSTVRPLVSGLSNPEGAAFDPVSGDFVFSTFGGGNRLLLVRGFEAPGAAADLNDDGVVDVFDLLILLSNWGLCSEVDGSCAGDINGDCVVDVFDLLALLSSWGTV